MEEGRSYEQGTSNSLLVIRNSCNTEYKSTEATPKVSLLLITNNELLITKHPPMHSSFLPYLSFEHVVHKRKNHDNDKHKD